MTVAISLDDVRDASSIIDEAHLRRMTLGDERLECEVLQIFIRQAAIMIGRLDGTPPAVTSATAHTLLGSARGIGAWRLADAAERLERALAQTPAQSLAQTSDQAGAAGIDAAIAELKRAAAEVNIAIGARLTSARA